MSKEDKLVNAIIQDYKGWSSLYDEQIFEPEAHYNHYGTRGVADLFIKEIEIVDGTKYEYDNLVEVKSGFSVSQATGANEIVRQFNKMRRNFYLDEDRDEPDAIKMELAFTIEPETVKHVADNLNIYTSVVENDVYTPTKAEECREVVAFRSTDNDEAPIWIMDNNHDAPDTVAEWKEYLEEYAEANPPARRMLDYL